jgi:hypothetical protein
MDLGSPLLLAAGALALMQLPTNVPTTFLLPKLGTIMMANNMGFNNGFNYLGTMPTTAPPPVYGQL